MADDTFSSAAPPTDNTSLRTRLAEINAQMEQLQKRLDELAAARKPISDALASIITGEIFMRYVAAGAVTAGGASLIELHNSDGGPLLLSKICRGWRDISLNLPLLWSRLRISKRLASTEKLLQCWLPRIGTRLLDLNITGLSTVGILLTLAPYLVQCRSLLCALPSSLPIHFTLGRNPVLKKLTILGHGVGRICGSPTPFRAFADAPHLSEATLYHITLPWIVLPWAQITRLQCYGQDVSECLEILHRTPHLETLSAHLRQPPLKSQLAAVHLDHLHTIDLHTIESWGSWQPNLDILEHITVPALKHLIIGVSVPSLSKLLVFLARSDFRLSSISLLCSQSQFPSVIFALEAAPTVNEVHLADMSWPSDDLVSFFNRLAAN
ncbi:hypothetical protein DFH09DRAFT_1422559 [Mycena vulgaris]|nr:hypothetical protein DFH09DRAFT_1422559 [Mycena vulgaris]